MLVSHLWSTIMASKGWSGNSVPIGDLASAILDPVLRKRTGISVGLIQSWEDIVGLRLALTSCPEKIRWPRRLREDDPFEPAVLVVACSGPAALHLQHETGEIISRVNSFLGFNAIGRIRIIQKPVTRHEGSMRTRLRKLTEVERSKIIETVSLIENEGLRESFKKLGATILGSRK